MRTFLISAILAGAALVLISLFVGCDPGLPAPQWPGQVVSPNEEPVVPQQVPKPTTYNEAVSIARQYERPLFLVFSATWCSPCKTMKADVWPNERVQEALKDYVVYMVDVDRERDVAQAMKIRTIPAYGIFDASSGKAEPVRVATGGRNVEEFVAWLNDTGL